jgi:flagellar assembly factor FliW
MKVKTKYFGEVEMEQEKQIIFKEGIPGFEHLKTFILIEEKESAFCHLQAVEEAEVSFTIVEPFRIKKDYAPTIREAYFESIGGGKTEDFALYVIVKGGETLEDTTVNLQGPLLIQVEKRQGVQAIVEEGYTTKHKLIDLVEERG